MKVAYASDLHFEFQPYRLERLIEQIEKDIDVLILAGDIQVADRIILDLEHLSNALPNLHIVYVTGNHEFYGTSISELETRLFEAFKDHKKIHYLEKSTFEINGVMFLGTTLWTGFDAYPEYEQSLSEENSMRGISDFNYIFQGSRNYNSSDCKARFKNNIQWLDDTLKAHENKTCIVVTHFPPLAITCHKQIPISSLSNYFQANCEDMVKKYSPKYWIYGHNHWSDKTNYGNTQFVSCQFGYPNENCNTQSMIAYIELED